VTSRDDATTPAHWDEIYASDATSSVSWFQSVPSVSLRLVEAYTTAASAVVDVGAGASTLTDHLAASGYRDLTVVDLSREALRVVAAREALGPVTLVTSDVLAWRPARRYDLWHDRALFHFLIAPPDQRRYVEVAARALRPGGVAVLGVFASDGPTRCSGLATVGYTADDLAARFAPAFALETCEREVHATPAGVAQPFTWVVLRRA
jgi:trans-aconitate methyltransferase